MPDLINLFLPGFIFMSVYGWIKNKKFDVSILTIWSLFISELIVVFYAVIHSVVLSSHVFNNYFKILIYVMTSVALPFLIIYLCNTKFFRQILFKTNNKSVNSDIFDDIIDYNKKTILRIYIKNSNVLYIGTFKIREEKGNESYIALINYASMNYNTKDIIFYPDTKNLKSSVAINLKDIERIELVYENDSEVWKRLMK